MKFESYLNTIKTHLFELFGPFFKNLHRCILVNNLKNIEQVRMEIIQTMLFNCKWGTVDWQPTG